MNNLARLVRQIDVEIAERDIERTMDLTLFSETNITIINDPDSSSAIKTRWASGLHGRAI